MNINKSVEYFINSISKKISFGLVSHGGRNFLGRLCVFHRGAGNKKRYILMDFFRRINLIGSIIKIIKISIYTSFVGLIFYTNA